MMGTSAADIIRFDVLLIPISLMADEGGPTNITFSVEHRSANSAFSDRKP